MSIRPLVALLAFLLSACAGGVGSDGRGFPSLARRPAETQGAGGGEEAAAEVLVAPPAEDPALKDRIATLARQAEQGGAKFDHLYRQVAGSIRVSAGAAVSSEQWVTAQQSLGRLEQARYDSVYALASLDVLYIERMKDVADGKAGGGVEEVGVARDKALAMVDSQNDRVDKLRAALKRP